MEKSFHAQESTPEQSKSSAFKRTLLITLTILTIAIIIYLLVSFLRHPAHAPFTEKYFGGDYYGVDDDFDAFGIAMIILAIIVGLLITYCCCGWLGCIASPCR